MDNLTGTITQADIDAMDHAEIDNYGDGVAMQAVIPRTNEYGEEIEIAVWFEILAGEEPDNEAIYTLDRIIDAGQIS